MLSNFRRLIRHPLGATIALGFVALLGLAFVLSDRSGMGGGGTARIADADVVATVGNTKITVTELRDAVTRNLAGIRQQQPQADMAGYLAAGGVENTLEQLMTAAAFRQFADKQGMVVSKKTIDGIIASSPGLQGPDGKFSQQNYENALRAQGITDARARQDLGDQILVRTLLLPTTSTDQVPQQLALPYADLLLEKRSGTIALIPSNAMPAGAAPTDADLTTFYQRNLARYAVPERRQFRYAIVSPASVAAEATPTDAQVAAAYKADAASYAAADVRDITQVIVADASAAAALAAKVRGGTALDAAARAAGLAPTTLKDQKQDSYAAQTTPDVARAAFAAKQGDVVGPLKGPLGYIVLRVEAARTQAGKTLAEATPDLRAKLVKGRTGALLAARRNAIDDALSSKTGFDTIVSRNGLSVRSAPPLTAAGINIDDLTAKPDEMLAPLLKAAFVSDPADGPQTVPTAADGSFAVISLDKVMPPAPRPLVLIRERVVHDFTLDRQQHEARKVAGDVIAAINKGTPLAQALTASGVKLPPADPVTGTRAQLLANPQGAPAPFVLLFSMAAKTAKLAEAPGQGGYAVVYLDSIVPGNASGNAQVIAGTRADLAKAVGREYGQQLSKAVQQAVGTRRNDAAVAALKAQLGGASTPDSE